MSETPPNDIIFYDGYCALCHFWVKFTLARDTRKNFSFSPLQGETIKDFLSAEEITELPDSIIVLTTDKQQLTHSSAACYILKNLSGTWPTLGHLLSFIPKPIRDFGYSCVAKIRRKLFKKPEDICPTAPLEVRDRILL